MQEERKQKNEEIIKEMVSALHKEQAEKKKPIQNDEEDEYELDEYEQFDRIMAEDGRADHKRLWRIDEETTRIEDFIRALPTCLLLTVGFDASGHIDMSERAKERCFCPCGVKMKRWRKLAHCEFIHDDDDDACHAKNRGVFDIPNNLVAHLRDKKNTGTYRLHGRVLEYLDKLYSNYWPNGLKHKALYIPGDANYKKAEIEEKRRFQL